MALYELKFSFTKINVPLNHAVIMSSHKNKFNISFGKAEKRKANLDLLLNSYLHAIKSKLFYNAEMFK